MFLAGLVRMARVAAAACGDCLETLRVSGVPDIIHERPERD